MTGTVEASLIEFRRSEYIMILLSDCRATLVYFSLTRFDCFDRFHVTAQQHQLISSRVRPLQDAVAPEDGIILDGIQMNGGSFNQLSTHRQLSPGPETPTSICGCHSFM
jgi:hypothetical protein